FLSTNSVGTSRHPAGPYPSFLRISAFSVFLRPLCSSSSLGFIRQLKPCLNRSVLTHLHLRIHSERAQLYHSANLSGRLYLFLHQGGQDLSVDLVPPGRRNRPAALSSPGIFDSLCF